MKNISHILREINSVKYSAEITNAKNTYCDISNTKLKSSELLNLILFENYTLTDKTDM